MQKTTDGGVVLSVQEVDGLKLLLLAEQRRVADIHATTHPAVNDLVDAWERTFEPLPELYR